MDRGGRASGAIDQTGRPSRVRELTLFFLSAETTMPILSCFCCFASSRIDHSLEIVCGERVTPHAQWGHLSWVRMSPLTGRTHQLRLHAAGLGCPIVGDDLYWGHAAAARRSRGGAEALPPVRASGGLFLQSCGVAFAHPDPQRGLVQVMVGEAPKFGALRARARSGAQYHGL